MSAMNIHTIPTAIEQAFYTVYRGGTNDQKFETFASHWGGLDLATFQRVVEAGEGDEKLVAMYVMGYSSSPQSDEILVPFLHSTQLKERWVSALSLGMRQDERAFPALRDLLLDGLSLEECLWTAEHPETERARDILWIRDHRYKAVALLEHWEDSSLIPMLKSVFHTIWDRERDLHHSITEEAALDELAYVLGHHGDFSVLDGLELPPAYTKTAMVFLVLGSLNARSTLGSPTHISAMLSYADIAPQVVQGLMQRFGLTADAAQSYVDTLYANKLCRYNYGQATQDNPAGHIDHDAESTGEDEPEEEVDELAPAMVCDPPLLCNYRAHREYVHDLAWSPDGLRLVSASADGSAKVWDGATGELLATFLDHHESVNAVSWSPDGTSIASASWDHTVQIWEPFSGKTLQDLSRA